MPDYVTHRERLVVSYRALKGPLAGETAHSPTFTAWRSRTAYSLEVLFGTQHHYRSEFLNRHFCTPRVQIGQGQPAWLPVDQEIYDRDRQFVLELLYDAMDDAAHLLIEASEPERAGMKKKRTSVKPARPGVQNIYNLSDQARVNLQSVDQSTNTMQVVTPPVFQNIRAEIEQGVKSAMERKEILKKLDELQAAHGSIRFIEKYQAFIAAAANHMTLLAPFIPALTSLLKP